jgi:hypothetical protein
MIDELMKLSEKLGCTIREMEVSDEIASIILELHRAAKSNHDKSDTIVLHTKYGECRLISPLFKEIEVSK